MKVNNTLTPKVLKFSKLTSAVELGAWLGTTIVTAGAIAALGDYAIRKVHAYLSRRRAPKNVKTSFTAETN